MRLASINWHVESRNISGSITRLITGTGCVQFFEDVKTLYWAFLGVLDTWFKTYYISEVIILQFD